VLADGPGSSRPPIVIAAVVDSGAHQTTFPLASARALGIADRELLPHPTGGWGVRSRFDLWTTSASILARVREHDRSTGAYSTWGPAFRLSPWFVDDDEVFLLGRADFFAVFTITFEEGRGRVFHLDI
jgi:hypothetical protein